MSHNDLMIQLVLLVVRLLVDINVEFRKDEKESYGYEIFESFYVLIEVNKRVDPFDLTDRAEKNGQKVFHFDLL